MAVERWSFAAADHRRRAFSLLSVSPFLFTPLSFLLFRYEERKILRRSTFFPRILRRYVDEGNVRYFSLVQIDSSRPHEAFGAQFSDDLPENVRDAPLTNSWTDRDTRRWGSRVGEIGRPTSLSRRNVVSR